MTKHQYTILSMMKNEGHCLLEWVAYHHLMGFDNICVYTNNCSDGTDEMLIRLEEMGITQHFRNDVPEGKKPQPNALNLAQSNPEVCDSEWIMVMDADEFLNIKAGDGTVGALMEAMPKPIDAINITWRFFGSNDVTPWNPGLVTESLTRAAPDAFKKGWGVKTMFRPYNEMKLGIHRPHIKKAKLYPERPRAMMAQTWVNGSGKEMQIDFKLSGWRSTKPTLGYDLVELNHYAVKSYEAYLLRRMRGNVNNKTDKYNASYFSIFDRNEIEVRGAADRGPAVRAKMDEWLQDEQLAQLQKEALAFHEAQVKKLRETGEYDEWLAQLKQAGKLSIKELDEVLFTLHLPMKYQEVVKQLRARGVPDKVIAKMINSEQTGRKAAARRSLHSVATDGDEAASGAEVEEIAPDRADPDHSGKSADEIADEIFKTLTQPKATINVIAQKAKAPAQEAAQPAPATSATPETPIESARPTPAPDPNRFTIRPRPEGAKNRRIVVSTMKNEGPYIVEWIAHYLNLGFDGFVLFSNDCTDGTNLILNRLDAMGIVQHFDNPLGPRMDPQRRAYSRANRMDVVKNAEWVMIVDADEFLNIHTGDGSLDALLEALPDETDAVSINWRLFGSSGAKHMDPSPVTKRFTRACNVVQPENGLVWGFKTLFRPKSFDYFGVHRPRFNKDREVNPKEVTWVTASGKPIGDQYLETGWRSNARVVSYEFGQVNHYAVKSREEFVLKKLRGTANSKDKNRIDLEYWDKFDLNTFEDTSIRSGDLEGRMNALLADPELRVLHDASLDVSLRAIEHQLEASEQADFINGVTPSAPKDAAE
jgi:hypothetical protein